ncbi:S41 family peptidase [Patescibacteria group bacterium]
MQSRKYVATYVFIILLLASFGIGLWVGRIWQDPESDQVAEIVNKDNRQVEELDFGLFWNVFDMVKDKYYAQPVDDEKLFYGAIKGMVEATDDPYSAFMDPEETKEFEEELDGTFEGIGIEIAIKKDRLTVVAPLEGTPAKQAGLRAGDWIVKIDDELTLDMNLNDAVRRIRGPKGSAVQLTISRDGLEDPQEYEITRETIEVKSVETAVSDDGIAVIEVSQFGNDTNREFDKAVRKVLNDGARGIILDLRNNPGGLLDSAIKMSSEFIDTGVVVQEDMGGDEIIEHRADGDARLKDIPVVILINEGSASASEIVAGALRDQVDAQIIGQTSFGKGSVQDLESLPQDTSLRITVAKWLTPNGDQIDEVGIKPNHEIEMTDEDYENDRDPQMDKAYEVLKGKL